MFLKKFNYYDVSQALNTFCKRAGYLYYGKLF